MRSYNDDWWDDISRQLLVIERMVENTDIGLLNDERRWVFEQRFARLLKLFRSDEAHTQTRS